MMSIRTYTLYTYTLTADPAVPLLLRLPYPPDAPSWRARNQNQTDMSHSVKQHIRYLVMAITHWPTNLRSGKLQILEPSAHTLEKGLPPEPSYYPWKK